MIMYTLVPTLTSMENLTKQYGKVVWRYANKLLKHQGWTQDFQGGVAQYISAAWNNGVEGEIWYKEKNMAVG